jgi:hypothetical protein
MLEFVERVEFCVKADAVMIAVLEVELGVTVVIGMEASLAEVAAEGLKLETASLKLYWHCKLRRHLISKTSKQENRKETSWKLFRLCG